MESCVSKVELSGVVNAVRLEGGSGDGIVLLSSLNTEESRGADSIQGGRWTERVADRITDWTRHSGSSHPLTADSFVIDNSAVNILLLQLSEENLDMSKGETRSLL
jgi:hypothetical protein